MSNRITLKCERCGIELSGGLDTFGDIGHELCQDCWYEWEEETNGVSYYGMAPHIHDLTITGSYIGSTIMLDYKAISKQDERGRYWIEDRNMWFTPDYEPGVDGYQGMWEER